MTSVRRTWLCLGVGCWSLCLMAGCGTSNSPTTTANDDGQAATEEESPIGLPTVAIGQKPATKPAGKPGDPPPGPTTTATAAPAVRKPAEKGTPEWAIEEIQRIKALPLPGDDLLAKREPKNDEDDPLLLTPQEEELLKKAFEQSKVVRRERNQQIIKLAESCIARTAKQADMEPVFDAAVHYLLDSRLQLALQGDAASIESLYDCAKVFYERKPDSASAVESELSVVNLTHQFAIRYEQSEPKWLKEFAKHSQLFAARFPDEKHRSVQLLAAAAKSCELAGMREEAMSCYSLLMTKFADTTQAAQAKGVVRRLELKGKKLELTGPTIDGGEFDIQNYRGKMVVVVFWASHARPFIEQLATLQKTMKTYEKYAVAVGVSLDADENALETFMERSGLTWPQIFSPNRALRGWNSPLAVQYGINNLPTIWLVDPNGVVVDTAITAEALGTRMHDVYLPFIKANAVRTTSGVK